MRCVIDRHGSLQIDGLTLGNSACLLPCSIGQFREQYYLDPDIARMHLPVGNSKKFKFSFLLLLLLLPQPDEKPPTYHAPSASVHNIRAVSHRPFRSFDFPTP